MPVLQKKAQVKWWCAIGTLLPAALAGCREPPLPEKPLPALRAPGEPEPIPARLGLAPGERWTWEVRLGGLPLGQAEMAVGPARGGSLQVKSRFRTRGLAAQVEPLSIRLETVVELGSGRPLRSVEIERSGARSRRREARLGTRRRRAHDLHTALAAVRAWSAASPARRRPGYLYAVRGPHLYRVEVSPPRRDRWRPGLRLEARAKRVSGETGEPLTLTVWLSEDERRAPISIEASIGRGKVIAELID